jgi:hypothetical protein
MKITQRLFIISIIIAAFALVHPLRAAVGYVNKPMNAGVNLFVTPLFSQPNDLISQFGNQAPEGTTISLWNPTANAFDLTSIYIGGVWTVDFTLQPGIGARLITPSAFVNTFLGTVLDHSGAVFTGPPLLPPPPFSGPNGIYLLGDKAPVALSGTDVFLDVLGRLPNIGEQFTPASGVTSTYQGDGNWDLVPSLAIAEAGFFNVGPVPEPSAAALLFVGLVVLHRVRGVRRRLS